VLLYEDRRINDRQINDRRINLVQINPVPRLRIQVVSRKRWVSRGYHDILFFLCERLLGSRSK